jgi:hypothetical protein
LQAEQSSAMQALYYPFHLCHDRTIERLLADYQTVHFRDFMALQLTPIMGTTAFPDRMGDYHPELLKAGRIVQGHNLSGSMKPETVSAVNRDLADHQWRQLFQESLLNDRRFQRGLFADPQDSKTQQAEAQHDPEWLQLGVKEWADTPFQVETVQTWSRHRLQAEEAANFEYGWALIKTAASLIYTIQLCHQLSLVAATDSASHHRLLTQTCERDQIELENSCVKREGY